MNILKPWKEKEELSIEDALKELENYETPTQALTHEIKFGEYKIDSFEIQNGVVLNNFQTPFGVFDKLTLYKSVKKLDRRDLMEFNSIPQNQLSIIPLWLDFGARKSILESDQPESDIDEACNILWKKTDLIFSTMLEIFEDNSSLIKNGIGLPSIHPFYSLTQLIKPIQAEVPFETQLKSLLVTYESLSEIALYYDLTTLNRGDPEKFKVALDNNIPGNYVATLLVDSELTLDIHSDNYDVYPVISASFNKFTRFDK